MNTSSLSFRKEILDYLRCCQRLLTSRNKPKTPFSKDELEVLEYAVAELQKVLFVRDKQ
jgi:hypothetical protein